MKSFTDRLSHALETELYKLSLAQVDEAKRLQDAIGLCKKALAILKKYLSGYFFESLDDEIEFFKYIKPRFYSKYIYHISIYNFHIKKPAGSDEILKAYISSQLADLKHFFDKNQVFYQYYRANSNYLDNFYFTRGNFDIYHEIDDFQGDEMFSTSHDYKVSKLIANEQFQEYLLTKCKEASGDCTAKSDSPVLWTGNQTDLVELLYALVESGSFNNGNVQIKSVILYFQNIFQIDLKYYYHKFTDISNRKKERTVFLDRLKASLTKKMDSKLELDKPELKRIRFS
jgi:hypothetical protein